MSSIRLRAISSLQQFTTIKEQIRERLDSATAITYGVARADDSEFGLEATITFATGNDRTRGAKIVRDALKTSHPRIEVDETLLGVTVLASPLQNLDLNVDIVAVHGLGGHATDSWSSTSPAVRLWLRDILPMDLPHSRIITFGYDSAIWSRSTAGVKTAAIQLLNNIGFLRVSEEATRRPVIFLAHSLGGLIVKQALALARSQGIYGSIHDMTSCIAFFATPHRGSPAASWGKILGRIVSVCRTINLENLDLLQKEGRALEQLSEEFVPLQRDGHIMIFSVFELRKTRLSFWRSIEVVQRHSALLTVPGEQPVPSDAAHRDVCKLGSQQHEVYRILLKGFRDVLEGRAQTWASMRPSNRLSTAQTVQGNVELAPDEPQGQVTFPLYISEDPHFFGREGLLEEIVGHLLQKQLEGNRCPVCLALTGIPGIGKTSLAKRVLHKMKGHYDGLFLFSAETRPKLLQGFLEVSRILKLGQPGGLSEAEVVRAAVLNHITNSSKRWLLIYDNVDEISLLHENWPIEGNVSVIVTSNNANVLSGMPHNTKIVRVSGFTADQGERFILARLRQVANSEPQRALARAIATRFHCWPLALRQLSAFLEESQTTMEEISAMLAQNADLENEIYSYRDSASSYEHSTLAAAWVPILSRLPQPATRLLNILSLVDPDEIPSRLFACPDSRKSKGALIPFNEIEFRSARAALLKYDIVQLVNSNTLFVHRSVQGTRLRRMTVEDRDIAFNMTVELLINHFPQQLLGNHMHDFWSDCELFFRHVLAFDNAVRQWDPLLQDYAAYINMICDCTWYLWEMGQYDEALERLEWAEQLCNKTIGLQGLEAARIYVNKGSVFSSLNRYDEAGQLFQDGLKIRKQILPEGHQLLVNSYMQVGNYYTWQEKITDAIFTHGLVISMREKSSSTTPGMMIVSCLNLSRSLLMGNFLDEAEKILEKASSWETRLPNAREAAYCQHQSRFYIIGNINLVRGDLKKALEAHQKAYRMREDIGATQFLLSASQHKIGVAYAEMGDFKNSITSLRKEVALLTSSLGNSMHKHARLARAHIKLAEVLDKHRFKEDAAREKELGLKSYEQATGVFLEDSADVDFERLVPPIDR